MQASQIRLLAQGAALLGVPLTERQLQLFSLYYREIMTWNEKINLLSRNSTEETLRRNCLDSLTVLPFLPTRDCKVLDMGSGGGFPGIPLKLAIETLRVSLLEASRKKTSFLKQVIRTLELPGITVLHDRAENLPGQTACAGQFDVVVSQAAFKLPQLLVFGAPLLAADGVLLAMKSDHIEAELQEGEAAATAAGLCLAASHKLTLPLTGEARRILIYKKTATPKVS